MANRRLSGLFGAGGDERTNKPSRRSTEPPSRWGIPLIFLAAILALWLGFRLVPDLGALLDDVPLLSPSATSEPKLQIRSVASPAPSPPPAATADGNQAPQPSPTPRTVVPNLIQLSEERAVSLLQQHRLAFEIEEVFNDDVAPGLVVSQFPEANAEVDEGYIVRIRLSKGPENPTMPDVLGVTVDNAREQLSLLGVIIEEVEQGSNSIPAGVVMAQEPPAGTQVVVGSTVRLTVSAGVDRFQVPDVRDKQFAIALEDLSAIGLRGELGISLTNDSGTCGTVASQSPAPGLPLPENSVVTLNIRGAPGCTPP